MVENDQVPPWLGYEEVAEASVRAVATSAHTIWTEYEQLIKEYGFHFDFVQRMKGLFAKDREDPEEDTIYLLWDHEDVGNFCPSADAPSSN